MQTKLLDTEQLGDLIQARFTRTAFRLETLPAYKVASDGGDLARYLQGAEEPDPERKGAWLARLRREVAEGKRRQRVHVWRGPLSDYLRYEAEWGYVPNSEAGEDIRILDLAERPPPAGLADHDFWLLDDQLVVRMHYDDVGRFAGAEVLGPDALPPYRAVRYAVLQAAEPFASYWARHPEYHRAAARGPAAS